MRRVIRLGAALAPMLSILGASATVAVALPYAHVDQPGPPLTVDPSSLAASVQCHGDLQDRSHEPVLLLSATTVNTQQDFGYTLEKSLTASGFAWCTSDMPGPVLNSNMDDIQIRGQYVTYAIRQVYALAGQPIAVMGHSQGGMVMRWSLRFWPDTRAMVADVIGIAGSNHGSTSISAQCAAGCAAAFRQQAAGAAFESALNSDQETFAGIAYTEISSDTDEIETPNGVDGVSSVNGPGEIANVAIQQICPGDAHEHLTLAGDPVVWALADDALTHPGPADPARIDRAVCLQELPPGVSGADEAQAAAQLAALGQASATYPHASVEPPLDCYVFAGCAGIDAPTLVLTRDTQRRFDHHRRLRVRFLVRTLEGTALVPVAGVRVSLGRHSALTGPYGAATITLRLRGRRRAREVARAMRQGCNPGAVTVRIPGRA